MGSPPIVRKTSRKERHFQALEKQSGRAVGERRRDGGVDEEINHGPHWTTHNQLSQEENIGEEMARRGSVRKIFCASPSNQTPDVRG